MDPSARQAWEDLVTAEDAYFRALAALAPYRLTDMLREALDSFRWRRTALRLIREVSPDERRELLPALFPYALVSHSLLLEVRRNIYALPREVLNQDLPPLVAGVLTDERSDYEAYRRLAELLDELGQSELLEQVVAAARRSSDPDIQEVADDFAKG